MPATNVSPARVMSAHFEGVSIGPDRCPGSLVDKASLLPCHSICVLPPFGVKRFLPTRIKLICFATLVLPFASSSAVVFTVLHTFDNTNDGERPACPLTIGPDGYLYGSSTGDGTANAGVAFKISSSGSFTNLHSFLGGSDGARPLGGLTAGTDGFLYGTTISGGAATNWGTVFKITTNGSLTTLYSFTNGADGAQPRAGLAQGSDGFLYGATLIAPQHQANGTIFRVSTNGAFSSLHTFTGVDGSSPSAKFTLALDGTLYGVTQQGGVSNAGTIFKIANGAFESFHSFTTKLGGTIPESSPIQSADGNFYGIVGGGANSSGLIYRITTNGVFSNLFSLPSAQWSLMGGLIQARDGYLYGTTAEGGASNQGTIFRATTNGGGFTLLYSFTGGADGSQPLAGLVQGNDGSFYGTDSGGYSTNWGVIFRLTILPDVQFAMVTNSFVNFNWIVEPGGTYQLQSASDLSSRAWTNLGPPTLATNSSLAASDSFTNSTQRFYRLALSP